MSNFSYLSEKKLFAEFSDACVDAEKSLAVSYSTVALQSRRALELAVRWMYSYDADLTVPYQDNLSSLVHDRAFKDILDARLFPRVRFIIDLGNKAAHTARPVKRLEAVESLRALYDFVHWLDWSYTESAREGKFDEAMLPPGSGQSEEKTERMRVRLEKLEEELAAKDKRLSELLAQEETRKKYRVVRVTNRDSKASPVEEISEYTTRKAYIDVALELSGWRIGGNCREEIEVSGMPNDTGLGYADYVLYGANGKPLAVVEAKRTSVDPNVGRVQANLYADCLARDGGDRPAVFWTNGFVTWFSDGAEYPERVVSGFFSPQELAWFAQRRIEKKKLASIAPNPSIASRDYQILGIKRTLESFEKRHRKSLLVMATGAGKTRMACSLVDILTRAGWVKNILFLADRRELVRQAKRSFTAFLPTLSQCNLLDDDKPEESRMVFSTYPTMMNAIDSAKRPDGSRLFTNGHFDLVIVDEAHRSVYRKYRDIFEYFDCLLVGLTATPKTEIDHNTYRLFELENDVPTYAYELEEAVSDGYLNTYGTVETKLKFLEEGIKYDDLSDREREEWEDTFDEGVEYVPGAELNKFLFNQNTVDTAVQDLMERGIKVSGGDELGKTIIFAANTAHADFILKRINALYPTREGELAQCVYNGIKYVDKTIENFSVKNRAPRVAISVDMLDTGIDVPEIVNLVFFKKVRSKAKFNQMIGRGTRLCPDLFGPGEHKGAFLIFDYCGNFEFFRANKKTVEPKTSRGLSEELFLVRARVAKELQRVDRQDDGEQALRRSMADSLCAEVASIPRDFFSTRLRIEYVDRYSARPVWDAITDEALYELDTKVAEIVPAVVNEELARRFDLLMYSIMLSSTQGTYTTQQTSRLVSTAENLSLIASHERVRRQREVIERVLDPAYWKEADVLEHEKVRIALRDLIDLIERDGKRVYYTNFMDDILEMIEGEPIYNGAGDLRSYRLKVETYLKEHQDDLSVYKLRHNLELTTRDIRHLEELLWEELGSKDDYRKTYSDEPLVRLVARLVGLDESAANALFGDFLSDNSLNADQVDFVRMIVRHVKENGFLDKGALNDSPFTDHGDLSTLFEDRVETIKLIISRIDTLNKRIEAS